MQNSRLRKTLPLTAALLLGGLATCADEGGTTSPGAQTSAPAATTSASPTPVAVIPNLTGEMTQVTLDKQFVAGLTQLKLTPGTVGKATIKDGVASFPITGGNVKYFPPGTTDPYVQGLIEHDGSGLSLTKGDTRVELTDFEVDPGESLLYGQVSANGKVAVERAPLFFLDGRTLQPLQVNQSESTAVLEGTTVSLSAPAADLLNQTFKTDALAEFFPVGVAKITVKVPAS